MRHASCALRLRYTISAYSQNTSTLPGPGSTSTVFPKTASCSRDTPSLNMQDTPGAHADAPMHPRLRGETTCSIPVVRDNTGTPLFAQGHSIISDRQVSGQIFAFTYIQPLRFRQKYVILLVSDILFPAHAGVNPCGFGFETEEAAFPRTRGGEPCPCRNCSQ